MAVLGAALAKEVLGYDDANKAFRPWWDTTQDFLMYGMIVLGTYIMLFEHVLHISLLWDLFFTLSDS